MVSEFRESSFDIGQRKCADSRYGSHERREKGEQKGSGLGRRTWRPAGAGRGDMCTVCIPFCIDYSVDSVFVNSKAHKYSEANAKKRRKT